MDNIGSAIMVTKNVLSGLGNNFDIKDRKINLFLKESFVHVGIEGDNKYLDSLINISFVIIQFGENINVDPYELFETSVLNIQGNCISSILEVTYLRNLKTLILKNNSIKNIPSGISNLINLQILDLSHNKITMIQPNLYTLSVLEVLNLSHNKISKIPPGIDKLTRLDTLDISNNCLIEIHSDIYKLFSLNTIDLSDNCFTEIHDDIYNLPNLTYLKLKNDSTKNSDEIE
jgi:Leucine-rich repeat (LRR) protein